MTKSIFLFLLGILSLSGDSATQTERGSRISLMTSAPYDEEVFTVYGHAALRIYDPKQNIDIYSITVYLISPNLILSIDSPKERRIINWEWPISKTM